jgi:hypothetical protein
MKILRVIFICSLLQGNQLIAQQVVHEKQRVEYQAYVEDSASVFWTRWPDPFSQSTIRSDYPLAQAISYYNALPGKLTVGLFDISKDSIVYRFNPPPHHDSTGNFWPHVAEPIATSLSAIHEYFRAPDTTIFKFVLIVDERTKTILNLSFKISSGCYVYLKW